MKSNALRNLAVVEDPKKKHFGVYIKQERQKRNLSQQMLATRAGITKGYISILERGYAANLSGQQTRPSPRVANALADALGISRKEVRYQAFGLEETEENPIERPDPSTSFGIVYYEYLRLCPRQRRQVEAELGVIMDFVKERIRLLVNGE